MPGSQGLPGEHQRSPIKSAAAKTRRGGLLLTLGVPCRLINSRLVRLYFLIPPHNLNIPAGHIVTKKLPMTNVVTALVTRLAWVLSTSRRSRRETVPRFALGKSVTELPCRDCARSNPYLRGPLIVPGTKRFCSYGISSDLFQKSAQLRWSYQ